MKALVYFLLFFPFFLAAQNGIDVKFYHEKVGKETFIYADNNTFAPVSAEYTFKAENMNSELPNNSIVLVPPKSKKYKISVVSVIDYQFKYTFSYEVAFVLGDVKIVEFDVNYIYSLPFAKQKSYIIYQGYDGSFSHKNTYSLDFSLKEKDQVLAAREGKVVEIVDDNSQKCLTLDCAKFNNKIVILHKDGSFAEYVHLKKDGVIVQLGDEIIKDQHIGYSGDTGFSKGPHLHFSVYINNIDGTRKYFKTKFRTSKSKAEYLIEKKTYTKNY